MKTYRMRDYWESGGDGDEVVSALVKKLCKELGAKANEPVNQTTTLCSGWAVEIVEDHEQIYCDGELRATFTVTGRGGKWFARAVFADGRVWTADESSCGWEKEAT